MINDTIMFRVTIGALLVSVGFLAYRAKRRRGYKPFMLGLGAAVLIITRKCFNEIEVLFYSGIVLLVVASLWNSWPQKRESQMQKSKLQKEGEV